MSSLEIAELTGKQHRNVKRDIRKVLNELGKEMRSFLSTCPDAYGRPQEIFLLDHDLTMTLVSGYSVKLRHAVIVRLRELETGEATPWHEQQAEEQPLPDFTNPAEAARAWASLESTASRYCVKDYHHSGNCKTHADHGQNGWKETG